MSTCCNIKRSHCVAGTVGSVKYSRSNDRTLLKKKKTILVSKIMFFGITFVSGLLSYFTIIII